MKKNDFLREDIDLLLTNELWALKSDQTPIDPEYLLKNMQKITVRMKDIIDTGKLFFYFGEHNCQLCYQEIIEILNKYIEKSGTQNIIVIAEFDNLRNLQYFIKNTKIDAPIYYIQKNVDIVAINAEQPFFFVLDKSFRANFVFIPDKKYNENIEPYLFCVDKFLEEIKKSL
jgi:hypothetical protein